MGAGMISSGSRVLENGMLGLMSGGWNRGDGLERGNGVLRKLPVKVFPNVFIPPRQQLTLLSFRKFF